MIAFIWNFLRELGDFFSANFDPWRDSVDILACHGGDLLASSFDPGNPGDPDSRGSRGPDRPQSWPLKSSSSRQSD